MKGAAFGKTFEEILTKDKHFKENLVVRVVIATELRELFRNQMLEITDDLQKRRDDIVAMTPNQWKAFSGSTTKDQFDFAEAINHSITCAKIKIERLYEKNNLQIKKS